MDNPRGNSQGITRGFPVVCVEGQGGPPQRAGEFAEGDSNIIRTFGKKAGGGSAASQSLAYSPESAKNPRSIAGGGDLERVSIG